MLIKKDLSLSCHLAKKNIYIVFFIGIFSVILFL